MKKIKVLFLTSALVLGTLIFYISKDNAQVSHESLLKIDIKSPNSQIEAKTPIQHGLNEELIQRVPAETIKQSKSALQQTKYNRLKQDIVKEFEKIDLGQSKYSLVTNYRAERISDEASVKLINGFDIVESSNRSDANIVFNSSTNRYGVWTREISIIGDSFEIEKLQNKFSLVLLTPGASPIFLIPEEVHLDQLYLGKASNLQLEPDIQYSTLKHQ